MASFAPSYKINEICRYSECHTTTNKKNKYLQKTKKPIQFYEERVSKPLKSQAIQKEY